MITYGAMPSFLQLLRQGGAVRSNYRGESVPVGAGFFLIWVGCISGPLLLLPFPSGLSFLYFPTGSPFLYIILFTTTALGYGLLGLLDDLVGSRRETGLKGHGLALKQGRLTSGAVKALVGATFGLAMTGYRLRVVGSFPGQWPLVLCIDGLLIAASANTLNLLDLRPGRAGKAFLFGSLLLILTGSPLSLLLLPWMGSLVGYLPFDLRGEAMMGDVGSNALGALLGLTCCCGFPLTAKCLLLLGLIFLHILAERVSFSNIIDNYPLLRTLDAWGRKDS